MRLKFGFEQAKAAQGYENLAHVVSAALGGKKQAERTHRPQNMSQAKAAFAEMFGGKSVG